jgi:hypothetical protein
MKRISIILAVIGILSVCSVSSFAQKTPKAFDSLERQLAQEYDEFKIENGTALERLVRENQDFEMLRTSEASDKRGLPPWLRVWWRKNHPEENYSAKDPTGGYPLVLKEILEWMLTHQDLMPGPGFDEETKDDTNAGLSDLLPSRVLTIGANLRTSGLQTAPRSESDIRVNFFDPTKVIAASNNISAGGRQGIYYSTNTGASWSQTLLPLTAPDTSQSDPTIDWTNDGRTYSSTLGIQGATLRLRNYFSTTNGATWSLDATPSGTQTNVDKQLVWVDHSATSPFFGRQYAIWHNGNPAFVNRRTAGAGGTWLAAPIQVSGAEITGTAIGSDIRTNSAGDVFGFYPGTGNRKIAVVKSTNGGSSWSAGTVIATTFDSFDIGIPAMANRRLLIYVSGSAYKTAAINNVYATWADLSGNAGCTSAASEPGTNAASSCKSRIWFSRSINGGTSWSAPVRINNQAGLNDQFNQAMAVDEVTGRIVIIYYDTVGDSTRKKTNVWMQSSTDNGATFSAATQITSATTNETVAGADLGNQYGDYNGLSGYNGCFFPSWTDRRSNLKEEIWTSKICF